MTTGDYEGRRKALVTELQVLLDEPRENAQAREQALVLELQARPEMPLVLFGAGNLGRRTLALLRKHGREVAAFADNDSSLWGTFIEQVPVLSPEEASARFSAQGLVLVTIWRAEGGHDFGATRDTLRRLGWRRVESFIRLFWGWAEDALPYITIDLPSKVIDARDEVMAAASLWTDDHSLRDYVGQIRWRLTGEFGALSPAEPGQYFAKGVVRVGPDEVFVDCGAFGGDTLLDVARRVGSWRQYHAFEPDPASFATLQAVVASLPAKLVDRVCLHRAAVADRRCVAQFSATGTGSASLSAAGAYQVDCVAIDEVVTELLPTFIKMDVEGAEPAALAGSRRVISEGRPLLAVAAYHNQADLWELPPLILALAVDYRMFLRPHGGEGFDTVLYAMPPERLVSS